jgi:hypothetical protein
LEQGLLAARGCYKGNVNDIRFIINDDRQIFKATIKAREKVDPEVCKRFTGILIELPKFFAIFPRAPPPSAEPQSFEPD